LAELVGLAPDAGLLNVEEVLHLTGDPFDLRLGSSGANELAQLTACLTELTEEPLALLAELLGDAAELLELWLQLLLLGQPAAEQLLQKRLLLRVDKTGVGGALAAAKECV